MKKELLKVKCSREDQHIINSNFCFFIFFFSKTLISPSETSNDRSIAVCAGQMIKHALVSQLNWTPPTTLTLHTHTHTHTHTNTDFSPYKLYLKNSSIQFAGFIDPEK